MNKSLIKTRCNVHQNVNLNGNVMEMAEVNIIKMHEGHFRRYKRDDQKRFASMYTTTMGHDFLDYQNAIAVFTKMNIITE